MHTPVLLKQAIENLEVKKGGLYIDATYGEGGYTSEILNLGGRVLAIDLDAGQVARSKINNPGLLLVEGNFADIEGIAREKGFLPVDGVVFDLGLSMGQLDNGARGLSYNKPEEVLDMRIAKSGEVTAADLLNELKENELYEILARNSEEIKSKEIARSIKSGKKITTVADLIKAIDRAVGFQSRTVYARIFQALRIEVNHEFENLKNGLEGASKIIKRNGKIVVVSFHSLEDRIVKKFGKSSGMALKKVRPVGDIRSFERSAKIKVLSYNE